MDCEETVQHPAWDDENSKGTPIGTAGGGSTGSLEVLLSSISASQTTDTAKDVAAVTEKLRLARGRGVDSVSLPEEVDTLRNEIKRRDIFAGEIATLSFLSQISQQLQKEEEGWKFNLIQICDSKHREEQHEIIHPGSRNGQDNPIFGTTDRNMTYDEYDLPATMVFCVSVLSWQNRTCADDGILV